MTVLDTLDFVAFNPLQNNNPIAVRRRKMMAKINLVVRYGSKPLEFAKGKNAIELASETEVADTLRKVREAAELGELDTLIEQQAQFGRRVTQKNK